MRDFAFDPLGRLWILDDGRLLRYPAGAVTASTAADLEIPIKGDKLAFDSAGNLWVVDNPRLTRLSAPITAASTPQVIYTLPEPLFANAIQFDAAGNLWIARFDRILRFGPPFSSTMQPETVIGQPSLTASLPPEPRQNRLTRVSAMRFAPTGELVVADDDASRILIFRPPFSTFMNASDVIGQRDFTSFRPANFAEGGLAGIVGLAFDSTGGLWVYHNMSILSFYRSPLVTGQIRDFWVDMIVPRPENPPFPYSLSAVYFQMRFGPDQALWLGAGSGWPGHLARLEVPLLAPGAVRHAATLESTPIAPGMIATLFGAQLGSPAGLSSVAENGRLPLSLGKTQVKLNGKPVPLLYASDRQVNFVVPLDLSVTSPAKVDVVFSGLQGPPLSVPVAPIRPGLFTLPGGVAAVLNHEYSTGPLLRGRFGVAFATGLGAVTPTVETGAVAGSDPPSTVIEPVAVWINGTQCRTLFAGLAPGFSGLYQVNFEIPAGLPAAPLYRLQLRQAASATNAEPITLQ